MTPSLLQHTNNSHNTNDYNKKVQKKDMTLFIYSHMWQSL